MGLSLAQPEFIRQIIVVPVCQCRGAIHYDGEDLKTVYSKSFQLRVNRAIWSVWQPCRPLAVGQRPFPSSFFTPLCYVSTPLN